MTAPTSPSISLRLLPQKLLASPWLWGMLVFTVALHLVMACSFELSTDEAHYALYAAFPAWSYFDHPPLVGWLQIPFVFLFEQAPDWVLRLPPMLFHALTLLALTRFAFCHFGEKAAIWTALIVALSPLPHLLGAALLPDTLLMLWLALLLNLIPSLLVSNPARKSWLAFGVLLGLAGLSKYTAAFFLPSLVLILLRRHGLGLFRQTGPWQAMAIAALFIGPVIFWNAQHEWISFFYQSAHGKGDRDWLAQRSLGQFFLQLLIYGPLLTFPPIALLWRKSPAGTGLPADLPTTLPALSIREYLILATPPLLLFFYLAGQSNALPHWTAPYWLLLAPLSGWIISTSRFRLITRLTATLQGAVCLGVIAWMLSGGTPDPDGLGNPPADLYGWSQAGEHARHLAKERKIKHLAVQNWSIASRLAWYARPLPVHVLDQRTDQFDLWYGDLPLGSDALVLDWSPLSYALPVSNGGFEHCDVLDKQAVQRQGKTLSYFYFYACHTWGGHADPKAKENSP